MPHFPQVNNLRQEGKGKDNNPTSGRTLAKLVITVGGITTTATTKFHVGYNLEEEDADSFASSIDSRQSYLNTMNVENFYDAQEKMTNSDEQPDQETTCRRFNPTAVEAHQTKLITTAVKDLVMNPN